MTLPNIETEVLTFPSTLSTIVDGLEKELVLSYQPLAKKDATVAPLLCKSCKLPAYDHCYSEAGRREVAISGICEECFDELTND